MAEKKEFMEEDKEFISLFFEQLALAEKKIGRGELKVKKEIGAEEIIFGIEKKMIPSIMKKEKLRSELEPFTIEKEEKVKKRKKGKKKVEEELEAIPTPVEIEKPKRALPPPPIYQRPLPPLPKPPSLTKEWPLPSPKPAVPVEEEEVPHVEFPEFPTAPSLTKEVPSSKPEKPIIAPLDLGKLNPLVTDPKISIIECDGANLPVKVTRDNKVQETKLKLSEDEIRAILQKFEDRAGEPLTEPIFKAQVGNLEITAVISAFAGSKFVISKA